ncbi:DUF6378 domain-containing protein [Dyella sp.]|uniref:DUF6378 domain-containing protein n=1 Tax=Dyella sp. TaxID=1869338 RepID=UPI002840970C|nr:DUF6378 domain-containing protein [Dyella sp.]MDR3444722.1 DUF6378 domain-containing protein [Dyella sp.]
MKPKSVIVQGPMGCGKTTNGKRIADFLGLNHLVDDWNPADGMQANGSCYLTSFHPAMLPEGVDVLHYADVMAAVNTRDALRPKDASEILYCAADALGDRAEIRDQADGERSMARAIAAFNAVHGTSLTELQGWNFMLVLKIARSSAGRVHVDDYTDAAGYAALAGECAQRIHQAAA